MPKTWTLALVLLAARCGESSQNCSQNGECNSTCAADPDCSGSCEQDGVCNAACQKPVDPDCDCSANKACNPVCAAGTDPDCAVAGSQAYWPGFQGAAGTMRGQRYQVSGALVPGEHGKSAQGGTHQVDPGVRRGE
jgi:hypothetical protein